MSEIATSEDAATPEKAVKEIEERVSALFINGDTDPTVGAERVFLSFKVCKPTSNWWFRVHPSDDYCREVWTVVDDENEDEVHILDPALLSKVPPQALCRRKLFAAVTRNGIYFVWPQKCVSADGSTYPAWTSALEAAEHARTSWTQMVWDAAAFHYVVSKAVAEYPDPEWPEPDEWRFDRWVEVAFKNLIISDPNHILLQKIRGEA
jgi:hypothetical protein